MRPINLIVIHCSASPNGESLFKGAPGALPIQTPVSVIDGWHATRGFHRDPTARAVFNPQLAAIGYHYLIYRNGGIATGRDEDEVGAHVAGFNQKSLGLCLIGTDRFTPEQWQSLRDLVTALRKRYPDARVVGHRDLSPDQNANGIVEPFEWLKTCPGFDVRAWLARGMRPDPSQLVQEVQS